MNYYNPYFTINQTVPNYGLSGIFNRFNLSSILNGTQKALNIINQTIPIIKEAAPMMKNAKTMFKVMNEFKKLDTPSTKNHNNENTPSKQNTNKIADNQKVNYEGPTFFI